MGRYRSADRKDVDLQNLPMGKIKIYIYRMERCRSAYMDMNTDTSGTEVGFSTDKGRITNSSYLLKIV